MHETNLYDTLGLAIPAILSVLSPIIMAWLNNKKANKNIQATQENKLAIIQAKIENKEAIDNVKDEMNGNLKALTEAKEKIAYDAGVIKGTQSIDINDIDKVSQQLDEIWKYLKNRALSEATVKGLVDFENDKLVVSVEVRKWYENMLPELRQWYIQNKYLNEIDLFKSCQNKFGQKLMTEICRPRGIFDGSCIQIAIILSKEES